MRTHVTMWLRVLFEVEEEPPFAPRNIRDEAERLQVVIRSQLKLAGGTKASSALGTWWNGLREQGGVNVPNVGRHVLREDGWFSHDTRIIGTEAHLVAKLTDAEEAVLKVLMASLEAQGLQLTKS